jgi:TolB-like protein
MAGRLIHRFGDFELDVSAYALRWHGRRVRIERRPMDLLMLLVERRGELVTRAEIIDRLWGADVFVEVDVAINSAIRKVRQALRDPAEKPAYVETVQGKGYRFVGDVASPMSDSVSDDHKSTIVVLPFVNLGGGPDREYIADGFTEDVIAALGQVDPDHLTVIGRASVMSYKNSPKSPADIGQALNATYLLEASVRTEADSWRLTARLIRLPEQVHVWSRSYDGRPNNMLEWQRELSEAIAAEIRVTLSPSRLTALGGATRAILPRTTCISRDGTRGISSRPRRTAARSNITCGPSRSTRGMRLPGPAWPTRTRRARSTPTTGPRRFQGWQGKRPIAPSPANRNWQRHKRPEAS